jgi:hypothetical protein
LQELISGHNIPLRKLKHIEIEQKIVSIVAETTKFAQVAVTCTVRPSPKRPRHDTIIIQGPSTDLFPIVSCQTSIARLVMMHLGPMEGIAERGVIDQVQTHCIIVAVLRQCITSRVEIIEASEVCSVKHASRLSIDRV